MINLDNMAEEATTRKAKIMKDPMMQGLLNATPEQAFQWVENNVNDMQTAKELLQRLTVVCVYLLKRVD